MNVRLAAVAWLLALLCGVAAAEDRFRSVTFQNDVFAGRDGGGYSNGFAVSQLRLAKPRERVRPPALLNAIGPWLGVDQATLASVGLVQLMTTPSDLSRTVPDPTDAPYVGALFLHSAQVHVDGDQADLVAVDVGVIGPAALAEQTQRAVHRLVGSARPNGWDSQPSNRPLVGLARYRAWRHGSPGGDAILIAGATGSNLDSSAGVTLMVRYGSQLERSFAGTLPIHGSRVDPQAFDRGWFVHAALSGDRVFHRIGVSGRSEGISLRKYQTSASIGVTRSWRQGSLSLSLIDTSSSVSENDQRRRYGSLTWRWLVN